MKVSAIVSAYFCESYLEGRIANLIHQNLRPQIIVIAPTRSKEYDIADRLLNPLAGDLLIDAEPNLTIYEAWNIGAAAAQGEYLTSANADDRLARYGIERLAGILDRHPDVAVAYGDVDIVADLAGGFEYAWRIGYFRWAEGGLSELMKHCFLGPQPMWRKSLHDKYGLFDGTFKSVGDYEFWLRLAAYDQTFYHVREVLGIYLRRPDQAEARFNADGTAGKEIELARARYD